MPARPLNLKRKQSQVYIEENLIHSLILLASSCEFRSSFQCSEYFTFFNSLINPGFLVAYRNIFEDQFSSELSLNSAEDQSEREREHLHEQGQGWTEEQVSMIPLESDSEAIDYLARYNFNLEEALFSLHCEMGCGKGL